MGLRILIVDDALFMRTLLKDILQKAGYQVVGEAADGVEALEQYRQLRPDVMTLDIVMPRKTGIDALRELLGDDPTARVVMCSAMGQDSLVAEALAAGARDFIVKPFQEQRVLEVLRHVAGPA